MVTFFWPGSVYLHFCNNSINELMQTHTEVSMKWAQYNTLLWFSKTSVNTCLCFTNWHQFNGNIIKNMTRNPKSMWYLFDSQHSHRWASNKLLPANWGKTQSSPITLGSREFRGESRWYMMWNGVYDSQFNKEERGGKLEVGEGRGYVWIILIWVVKGQKNLQSTEKISLNKKMQKRFYISLYQADASAAYSIFHAFIRSLLL